MNMVETTTATEAGTTDNGNITEMLREASKLLFETDTRIEDLTLRAHPETGHLYAMESGVNSEVVELIASGEQIHAEKRNIRDLDMRPRSMMRVNGVVGGD